jgi:hypothetical protein
VVAVDGPKRDTGTLIEPQPTPFGLFSGDLKPLLTPDALHPLGVYLPIICSQQGRCLSASVTPISGSQDDNFSLESLLFNPDFKDPLQGGPGFELLPCRRPSLISSASSAIVNRSAL